MSPRTSPVQRAGVRSRIAVRSPSPRRPIDARLAVRAPAWFGRLPAPVRRLPPGSWLRRQVLARATRLIYEGLNRGDPEVLLARCRPEVEIHTARVGGGLDLDEVYRGREGLARLTDDWSNAWEEFRWEPFDLIDLGDRLLILARQIGRGMESGVEVELPHATVVTFDQRGWVVRVQFYWDWAEAKRMVGIASS
jgi:ketosteroid isomerase-like protein